MLFEDLAEVLDPEPHRAALNMAIDETLLRGAERPLLRIYGWEKPAASFGYFEKIAEIAAIAGEVELVRRWTGGGMVRHGGDLTYTLIVPAAHDFARLAAPESYRQIHARLAVALTGQGIATQLAAAAAPKMAGGCFVNPAAADVLAAGNKIAGGAQRRTRWGLLHQGSVQGVALAAGFAGRLAPVFGTRIHRRELTAAELATAEALAAEKYGTDAWLRRF